MYIAFKVKTCNIVVQVLPLSYIAFGSLSRIQIKLIKTHLFLLSGIPHEKRMFSQLHRDVSYTNIMNPSGWKSILMRGS